MLKKLQRSKGAVSSILLVLAIILIVVIVVVFVVITIASNRNNNNNNPGNPNEPQGPPEPPKPVYETNIGDIRFVFQSAVNLGSILVSKDLRYQQNITTTEKFIRVIIGAQNKGKLNIPKNSWDIGNIIDADGKNFVSINDQAYAFLPQPSSCGNLLKPDFEPTPCLKLYEVAKTSKKLKIEVNYLDPNSTKKQTAIIDLDVLE